MPTFGDFIAALAKHSGKEEDATIKNILTDPGLASLALPNEWEHLIENNPKDLLTIEAAKQHPELKKYFFATQMHGTEKDLDRYAKEILEFSDEDRAEINKIQGAQKRMEATFKMAKERLEKKAPPTDNEKVKKLETKISELNAELVAKDEARDTEIKTLKQGFLDKQRDNAFEKLFQSKEYTDLIPKNVSAQTARAVFSEKLRQDNNKIVFKEEDGSLQLLTNEDTVVYQNNKPVNLDQYLDSVLAENKLLKITPTKHESDGKKKEPMLVVNPISSGGKVDNSAFQRELENSLQDLGSAA